MDAWMLGQPGRYCIHEDGLRSGCLFLKRGSVQFVPCKCSGHFVQAAKTCSKVKVNMQKYVLGTCKGGELVPSAVQCGPSTSV